MEGDANGKPDHGNQGDKLPENKWYGVTASSTASVAVGESLP